MLAIVDCGMGNIGAIRNMLRRVTDAEIVLAARPVDIQRATKLILPGVGAFDAGMEKLNNSGLVDALTEKILVNKAPLLGICLGMQLLGASSSEGRLPGLGWIPGRVEALSAYISSKELKIPHMRWNSARPLRQCGLFQGFDAEARYYFVHSYIFVCENDEDVAAETRYGVNICSALQRHNIYGVQFHPEKSHRFGMALLKNFVDVCA